jgi:hypothetical protein
MPGQFGAPAKVNVMEEDNKIKVKLLSYDASGNLTDTVSNTLKSNILEYLSDYRMVNDYIDILSGEVIDMSLDISVTINKNESSTDVMRAIIGDVTSYFDITKRKMGDPLFVGDLMRTVGQISGVVNVTEIKVYNQIGGQYSSSEVSQAYANSVTKEIQQADSTIFMKSNQIFQIRFPNTDIRVRFKTLTTTTY